MESGKTIKHCRVCKSKELVPYLNLGETPLANRFVPKEKINEKDPTFPLEVLYCKSCSLSQLSFVVDPKILFSNYPYRSSVSKTFQKHCEEFVEDINKIQSLSSKNLVIDIASNDGCLLKAFQAHNVRTLGVDPAENLAEIANKAGIKTIASFWNEEIAKRILKEEGHANIITATNVFAHVDNIHEFVKNVKLVLHENGYFVFEVPYFVDLIGKNEFDTIYHEHLSYFLIKPLVTLFKEFDMEIFDTKKINIHGGSIRVFVKKKTNSSVKIRESVRYFLEKERKEGFYNEETYASFSSEVRKIKVDLLKLLNNIKKETKKVIAYGAPAKGNTLLNYCGIGPDLISFIIDDTPEKQNLFTPGQHILICSADVLKDSSYDYMLILAWNFAEEIMAKTTSFREKSGKYIIPIPEVRVLE